MALSVDCSDPVSLIKGLTSVFWCGSDQLFAWIHSPTCTTKSHRRIMSKANGLLHVFLKKPPPVVTLDMDEETQLQIALSLSKEEHQQV